MWSKQKIYTIFRLLKVMEGFRREDLTDKGLYVLYVKPPMVIVESFKIKQNSLEIANKPAIHLYFNEIEKKTIQKLDLCVRD